MSTTLERKRTGRNLQGWAPDGEFAAVVTWCRLAGISVSSFVRRTVVAEAERNLVRHVVGQACEGKAN